MDAEEAVARAEIAMAAVANKLDIFGGFVRRTSSRFCFSIEHGDYNGTELFGVGTNRFIWFAYKANGTNRNRLYSVNFPREGVVEWELGHVPGPHVGAPDSWSQFAHGVDYILSKNGIKLSNGIDGVLYGNIPGGGMSRSASLTINLITTELDLHGAGDLRGKKPMQIVDWSQLVENEYTMSPCGNLDQVMILFAREGYGTHYIPASRAINYVKFGADSLPFRVVVMDTGSKRHGLETSTYSIRAAECKQLCELAGPKFGIKKLADVRTQELFDKISAEFGASHPNLISRLRYIYEAQQRFYVMLEAWKKGDIESVGRLFREDGIGLRDKYVISGPELEAMCDIARTVPGVYGERMLGGGDKGASGLLCHPDAVKDVRSAVATSYPRGHPLYADKWAVHECQIVDGVKDLSPITQ
jgi:galactokinase